MNFGKTPNFAFKNTFKPKAIDISFKKDNSLDNDTEDICDEIESLLSELESHSAFEVQNNEKPQPDDGVGKNTRVAYKENTGQNTGKVEEMVSAQGAGHASDKTSDIGIKKESLGIKQLDNEKAIADKQEDASMFEFKLPKKCVVPSFKTISLGNGPQQQNKSTVNATRCNGFKEVISILSALEEQYNIKVQESHENVSLVDKKTEENDKLIQTNKLLENRNKILIQKIVQIEQSARKNIQNKEMLEFIQSDLKIYKGLIENEIKFTKDQLEATKVQNNKLYEEKHNIIKQNIEVNKKLQSEIDDLQQKSNILKKEKDNLENLLKDQKYNEERQQKLEQSLHEITREKVALVKDLEFITGKNDALRIENEKLVKKQQEFDNLLNLNDKLRQETRNVKLLEETITKLEKLLSERSFEIQKLKDENATILQEIKEKELTIEEQENKHKQMQNSFCEKKITFCGILHNLKLSTKNLQKTKNEIDFLKNKIDKIISQNIFDNLKAFYQSKFDFELKQFKREKMELTNKIKFLIEDNKKYKVSNTIEKIKSKYVEPSDSDIWNVFN